jgi:hypothetical protein
VRYEKKSDDSIVELVLDGARVHLAKGARSKGKDSDVRTYVFGGSETEAREFVENKINELLEDGYVEAGEATSVIDAYRCKQDADRAQSDAARIVKLLAKKKDPALVREAHDVLERWDAALDGLDETTRVTLSKLYGVAIERLKAVLEQVAQP